MSPNDVPDELVDALEALIFEAIGLTAAALSQSGAGELTVVQWRALVIVGQANGLRVGEVATRLGASMTATSRLVGRLHRRGYVSTTRDETDRRVMLVSLTKAGREVREQVIRRRRELMVSALSRAAGGVPTELAGDLAELAKRLHDYS